MVAKSLYEDYAEYTQKYKKEYGCLTMVLIEVGSFWEIYDCNNHRGADMKLVSELLNIQVTKKNKNIPDVSASNPLMAGFPSHALQRFLPLLLDANLTIVLVGQTTSPPNPKREVTQILSKGTCIDLFDVTNSNYVMSVSQIINDQLGASLIDLSTGATYTFEGNYDRFVKLLHVYKPCEIVTESKCEIKSLFGDSKVYIRPEAFKQSLPLQVDMLSSIFENESMLSIIEYLDLELAPFALGSFCALIDFCRNHVPLVVRKLKKPVRVESGNKLDVFYNTNEQLDVHGLNKCLNTCVTATGKRYFKFRLTNPFCDPIEIVKSLDKMKNMSFETAQNWRVALRDVYDIERLFRKSELGIITIVEMENILKSCKQIPEGSDIVSYIQNNFDFDNGCVKGDNDIDQLIDEIKTTDQEGDTFICKLNEVFNVQYLKLEKTEKEGWYINLTSKRWRDIQKHKCFSEYPLRLQYTTSSLVKVTHESFEKLSSKCDLLKRKLKSITALKFDLAISNFNKQFGHSFRNLIGIVQDLDFTSACVFNNHKYKYSCPNICTEKNSQVVFEGVRHPIIEIINETEEYVGNDICIESGKGTLLFGLNASGKSSLMKAVGLNIIMAQCGMFVAAASMDITPYESIFARISKTDNLYAGQSTFMVEMSELRKILKYSSHKSIVLADELCAGTESVSAISIVAAGIKTLADKGTSFIFATHLHELTKINIVPPCVNIFHLDVFYDKNMGMLVFNRKLCKGQGSELYGLEVCKSLDMDNNFILLADSVRSKLIKPARKSSYNSKLIVNKCAICKTEAKEVHHIKEQKFSDVDGYIGNIHKNKLSNLVALCNNCHNAIHKKEIEVTGYKMTTNGKSLIFDRRL